MDSVIEKSRCTGCHACFNACPAGAIRMEEDKEGFLFPVIDAQACVDCGLCRMSCPVLHPPELLRGESTYACAAAERDLRLASSSGAVFTLLAEDTLRDGGVVCGAAFDGPERVRHVLVETPEQLSRIKGAKYVQSEIGDVFQRIASALKSGRRVLFSGTGCVRKLRPHNSFAQRMAEAFLLQRLPDLLVGGPGRQVLQFLDDGVTKELSDGDLVELNAVPERTVLDLGAVVGIDVGEFAGDSGGCS